MSLRNTLVGASALAAVAITAVPAAQAQSATTLFGGGGTLAAKLYRDVFNCYSATANSIYYTSPGNNSTVANYPTTLNASCTSHQTNAEALAYEPVGSGSGINAFTTGNPVNFGSPATSNPVAYINNSTTVGASSTPYPEVEFAGSDAYLSSAQITAANTVDGASGSPNPIFQIPTLATPITLPVGSVTGVSLSLTDVCDVFSGQEKLTGNTNTTQQIYVRADGSGTSFIFSEWLATNCTGKSGQTNGKSYAFTAANGFPSTAPSWSAANVGLTTGSLATITAVTGSGGVANAIGGTSTVSGTYSIGYLSPDYTSIITGSPYPHVNPANVNGKAPNTTQTTNRLNGLSVPTAYTNNIGQVLNDALAASTTSTSGYPIVGFTFVNVYGCYSSGYASGKIGTASKGDTVKTVLSAIYPSTTTTFGTEAQAIINASGFVAPPTSVITSFYNATPATGNTYAGPLSAKGIDGSQCPSGRT